MSQTPASVPLARVPVDRDADARDRDDLIEELLADTATRVVAVSRGRVLLRDGGARLALLPVGRVTDVADDLVYLGRAVDGMPVPVGTALIAAVIDADRAAEVDPAKEEWQGLRSAAGLVNDAEGGVLVQAMAIAHWHGVARLCQRCGAPTVARQAGWSRRCSAEGIDSFPRTDPAVIVLITDDEGRALLGANAAWAPGRYSLLAGFVEPGESLEHAVIREVREESGLEVIDPVYRASQPWPFPASIMLGFTATLAPGQDPEPRPDGTEIVDLRWFSREDIRAAAGSVALPGPASIARALLEEWYGGPLPESEW